MLLLLLFLTCSHGDLKSTLGESLNEVNQSKHSARRELQATRTFAVGADEGAVAVAGPDNVARSAFVSGSREAGIRAIFLTPPRVLSLHSLLSWHRRSSIEFRFSHRLPSLRRC